MNTKCERKTYTAADIAEILGISLRAAYNLLDNTDSLQVIRIGKSKRVLRESFDNWLYGNAGDNICS